MPYGTRSRQLRMSQELTPGYLAVPKTANYIMQPKDTLVKTDTTNGAFWIMLPPVVESAGSTYVIKNVAGTNLVTVLDDGDAVIPINQTTVLLTTTAALIYYSDGERWYLTNSFA